MTGEAPSSGPVQLTFYPAWDRPRMLRPDELIAIFEPDDPFVTTGKYNVFGFTPSEWRAYQRKLAEWES